jgi:hypothetical protein
MTGLVERAAKALLPLLEQPRDDGQAWAHLPPQENANV